MKFHFRHDASSSTSSSVNQGGVLLVSQPVHSSSSVSSSASSSSSSSTGRTSRRRRNGRGFRGPARASRRTSDDGNECDGVSPVENASELANGHSDSPVSNRGQATSQAAAPSPAVHPVLTGKWSVPRPPSNPAASDDEDAERGHESDHSDCGATSDEDHGRMSVVLSTPPKRQFFRLVGRPRSVSRRGSFGRPGSGTGGVAGSRRSDDEVAEEDAATWVAASPAATGAVSASKSSVTQAASPIKPRAMGLLKPTLRRTVSLPLSASQSVAPAMSLPSTSAESYREDDGHTTDRSELDLPSNPTNMKGHRRHVTFTTIQVRQYSRILGDHPCCPSGPPLSLGWDMERQDTFSLEIYEKEREPERKTNKEGMRLNCELRREILESLTKVVPLSACPNSSVNVEESSSTCCTTPPDAVASVAATSSTTCCVYTKAELRRAERKLEKERAGNHRVQRKMNKCFFRPLTEEERKSMDCCLTSAVSANSADYPIDSAATTKEEPPSCQ
ncbi:hypothetical protein ACHAXS_004909 [Conticribra weissflogii]